MKTMNELTDYVSRKAKDYLLETGTKIDKFPTSIVDFVIEYAVTEKCHFPKYYTEEQMVADLERCKNSLAMACNDIYAKAGAEGQNSHSENEISRAYDSSWITPKLLSGLPNYVNVF